MQFISFSLLFSVALPPEPFKHSHHIAGNKGCIQQVPFSGFSTATAAARCRIKYKLHNSAATSQCLSHREPSPIKPHYLQGYHLPPTGVEIAAYLLVNNNKKRHITDKKKKKKKKPSYHDREQRFPGTVSFCGKGKQKETSRCNAAAKPKWKPAALFSGAKQRP